MGKEDLEPLSDSVSPNLDKNKDEVCLNSIFDKINKEYFNGEMRAKIIWSKNVPLKKRRSIMLGSFDEENNVIKISPCLKKEFVPIYFIESVVYHEMLHSIHAVKRVRGRNQIHGSSFKKDEKKFEHYKKSKKWLKENLAKLLSD
jgi:predicted SprT family Zn-dependent metalloprotease